MQTHVLQIFSEYFLVLFVESLPIFYFLFYFFFVHHLLHRCSLCYYCYFHRSVSGDILMARQLSQISCRLSKNHKYTWANVYDRRGSGRDWSTVITDTLIVKPNISMFFSVARWNNTVSWSLTYPRPGFFLYKYHYLMGKCHVITKHNIFSYFKIIVLCRFDIKPATLTPNIVWWRQSPVHRLGCC